MDNYSKKRGNITVEASIIVPVIIISISAVIYIGLLLYQRSLIQSAAAMAAEAGAGVWAGDHCEINTGKPNPDAFEKTDLYRRIFDSDKDEKIIYIENYARSLASRSELLSPVDTDVEVAVKDYVVSRRLEVKIVKHYRIPLGRFLRLVGGSDCLSISIKAISPIDEPVGLIRVTDFILDLEKSLEAKYPAIKNLGEKTRGTMTDIKSKLEEFLD